MLTRRNLVSSCLLRIGTKFLDAYQFERLVQLLQIVDEQMRPRPVHSLFLANNSFFKIEAPLTPPENLGHRGFSFQGTKNRVADRTLLQIDFADSPARFESETSASLAQAAHLQNFGRGKLVQIADQRMARVDTFGGGSGMGIE